MRDWHRIFGMSVAVTVTGRPFRVIQELELSQVRQRLDLAVIRSAESAQQSWPDLPDGFTDLAEHNIITYKSIGESLTTGSMLELLSHVVAYAKQHWRDHWETNLLHPGRLAAIAVSTQRPTWLEPDQAAGQTTLVAGVYEVAFLQLGIRVIVPREVARSPRNSLWHLLSGIPENVTYGLQHCNIPDSMLYNILNDLRDIYSLEGVEMPYTLEDYRREVMRENWVEMSPEERLQLLKEVAADERLLLLQDLSAEELRQVLKDLSADELRQVLKDLSAEELRQVLKDLSAADRQELLKDMPPEERLKGLSRSK